LDTTDLKILKALSGNINISESPFLSLAQDLGLTEDEVIDRLRGLQESGALKRIAPILYHHKTQYKFNALTIWSVEESRVGDIADCLMSFKHVSHVYERASCEAWSYNLYGMAHGTCEEDIDKIVESVKDKVGDLPHKIVYTVKEWKKTSPDLKYLLDPNRI